MPKSDEGRSRRSLAKADAEDCPREIVSLNPGFPDRTKPMPPEQSPDVKFEIGHVLFIDIVGYSKLLINEQSEQIQKLTEIVRGTDEFRLAEAEDKLLRLPTG